MLGQDLRGVPAEWKTRAYIDECEVPREVRGVDQRDPTAFWPNRTKRLHWYKTPTGIKNTTFGPGDVLDQVVRGR